jgi:hypothetical protein
MLRLGRYLLVLTLGFAACSSGDKNVVADNPQAALSVAARRTADGETVKMTLDAKTSGLAIASGAGAYDFKKEIGRFKLSGALLSAAFDLVITPDKIYVRTPTGPKKWASVTDADLQNGAGGFLSQIRSQLDPRETLRNLGATTKNVRVVGEEKLRGVATTHVRGDVDLSDAAIAKAAPDTQDSLRQARQSIGAESYPIEVWMDHDGRVRKFAYSLTVKQGEQTATTTVQLELYDFGKDPKIVIPNAADVKEGLN